MKIFICVIVGFVAFFALCFSVWGIATVMTLNQEPATPPVWGQGNPDPNHIKHFGNGNLSRLCYVQTRTINRQGQFMAELALRVSKLEDPND